MVFSIYYNYTYRSSLHSKSSIRIVIKFLKRNINLFFCLNRISKYDNINSHVISIDVKLRKPIQQSNRLSTLHSIDNIPILISMGYLKVCTIK